MICPHSMTHCSEKAVSWRRRGGRSAKSESCSLMEEAAVAAAERPEKTMSAELQDREVCQTWTVECCGAGGGGARCAQWKPLLPSDSTRTDTNYCCLNADEMHYWQTTKCPLLAVHYWSLLTRNAADAVAVAVPVEACCCHCCCCPLRILNQMKWQRL